MKLVRKEEEGGNCAICKQPVELLMNGETWRLSCNCKIVDVPTWIMLDSWSRRRYRGKFEWRELDAGENARGAP